MSSLHVNVDLDGTLGATFLGNIIASVFYGTTCIQTFTYYKHNSNDSHILKMLIFLLWFLDTLHLAIITHAVYHYLVTSYGNTTALGNPTWSVLAQVYVTSISDLIIRGVFGRRVWILAGRSTILAALIGVTSLTTFVMAFAYTTKAFPLETFEQLNQLSYFLYTGFACGVVADVLIASSLCICLSKFRRGFRRTDSLVNVLVVYSINTSVLTTICTLAVFITYTIWPQKFTYIAIYFSLSKLYLNSLLATLNSREAFSERLACITAMEPSPRISRVIDPQTGHIVDSGVVQFPTFERPVVQPTTDSNEKIDEDVAKLIERGLSADYIA